MSTNRNPFTVMSSSAQRASAAILGLNRLRRRLETVTGGNSRRVGRNISWQFVAKIVDLGVALAVGVVLARGLGVEGFGVFSFVTASVTLLGPLTYLGLSGIVARDIAVDERSDAEIVGTTLGLKFGGSLAAVLAMVCFAQLSDLDHLTTVALTVASLRLLCDPAETFTYWFQARVEAEYTAVSRIAAALMYGLLIAIIAAVGIPIILAVSAWVAQYLVRAIAISFLYWRRERRVRRPRRLRFSVDRASTLLSRSWPLLLSSAGAIVYLRLDEVMLRVMVGDASVGVYAAAARLSEAWYFLPTIVMGTMLPLLAQQNEADAVQFSASTRSLLSVGFWSGVALATLVTLAAHPVIHMLYGAEYVASAKVLMIHIWACPFVFMGVVMSKWLIIKERFWFSCTRHGAAALANLLLNFLLIPRLGATGAAVATVASFFLASYLACFTSAATRPLGVLMTQAMTFPIRRAIAYR